MSLVYVGVFIMSLAFALVSIFLAKLLLKASRTISIAGTTLDRVEKKLDSSIIEIESILTETANTATDVQSKLNATNGLFLAVDDIGQSTESVSSVLEEQTEKYNETGLLSGTKPFIYAIQIGEFGFGLLNSWKKGSKVSS